MIDLSLFSSFLDQLAAYSEIIKASRGADARSHGGKEGLCTEVSEQQGSTKKKRASVRTKQEKLTRESVCQCLPPERGPEPK